MSGIDALAELNPWPSVKPDAPNKQWGWGIDGQELLLSHIPADAELIVEVGSLLGGSARFFAEQFPAARLICIDPWFDVDDVSDRPFLAHNPELSEFVTTETDGIYRIFLASNWDLRDRVTALRGYSPDMLAPVHAAGVNPDVVYIDGSHVYEDVLADVITARTLFPDAVLCGDDWNWPGVQHAVNYMAANRGDHVATAGNTWVLEQRGDGTRRSAPSAKTVGPVERSLPVRIVQNLLGR